MSLMALIEDIQSAIKSDKIIFGYRKTIKFMKLSTPKLIIIAGNVPEDMRKEIEHNAKIGGVKVEIFNGTSKELGLLCGKPFPITTITIKG